MLEDGKPAGSPAPDARSDAFTGEEQEAVLRCAACDAPVTRERDRVERCGGHVHDRVNPAGVAFRLGCFGRADGVRGVGGESDEFPWFPRHRWLVVVCASCAAHVGWRFSNGLAPPFWGLVLERLK